MKHLKIFILLPVLLNAFSCASLVSPNENGLFQKAETPDLSWIEGKWSVSPKDYLVYSPMTFEIYTEGPSIKVKIDKVEREVISLTRVNDLSFIVKYDQNGSLESLYGKFSNYEKTNLQLYYMVNIKGKTSDVGVADMSSNTPISIKQMVVSNKLKKHQRN